MQPAYESYLSIGVPNPGLHTHICVVAYIHVVEMPDYRGETREGCCCTNLVCTLLPSSLLKALFAAAGVKECLPYKRYIRQHQGCGVPVRYRVI